jgi:site-specific recombinase XerC
MLENGTDTRVIHALLGHSGIVTTARYAQVSNHVVAGTPRPLDQLVRQPEQAPRQPKK